MKNNKILKTFLALMALHCATACDAAEKNISTESEIMQSASDLQTMSRSVQKINALFSNCKMQNDCILKGLQDLAQKEHDPLAISMLDEYTKKSQLMVKAYEPCFEFLKAEVDKALNECMTASKQAPFQGDPKQCYEKSLITLIDSGNDVAEYTLLSLYQLRNEPQNVAYLQDTLNKMRAVLDEKTQKKCHNFLKK